MSWLFSVKDEWNDDDDGDAVAVIKNRKATTRCTCTTNIVMFVWAFND